MQPVQEQQQGEFRVLQSCGTVRFFYDSREAMRDFRGHSGQVQLYQGKRLIMTKGWL